MTAQPDTNKNLSDTHGQTAQPESSEAQPVLDPFDDARIDGLFFPGGGRQDTLEQLQHLLRYGPALLVLDGDAGVGKHFLVNRMIAMLDPELFDLALIQSNVLNRPQDISSALSTAWRCPQELTLENRQQVLTATAQAADSESKTLLAVVRQAQHLSPESCLLIRELLAITAGLPVKFLLVVDAIELESAGYLYELISQVPDNFQLTLYPLTPEETSEYLAYRLRTAGLGQVRFNDEQLLHIHNQTLGNIQQINEMARDLLAATMPTPVPKPATLSGLPKMHLAALAIMAVVLVLLILMRGSKQPEPDKVDVADRAEQVQPGFADVGDPPAVVLAPGQITEAPATEPQQAGAETDASSDADQREAQDQVSLVEPVVVMDKPDETESVIDPTPEQRATVEQPVPEPAERAGVVGKTVAGVSDRSAWLGTLPKGDYVIQLLGAKEWKTVETFVNRYSGVKNLAYYRMARHGAPWYVVVQASYPNHDAASAAVTKLPQALQKQGPWIRKAEAIQEEIKNQ
ncbi:SPOR domain-containing protein [Ketobacter sp.]